MPDIELERVLGTDGDLKIIRECKSQRCCGKERVFERLGQTQDKVHWAYVCPICDSYYFTPIPTWQRLTGRNKPNPGMKGKV